MRASVSDTSDMEGEMEKWTPERVRQRLAEVAIPKAAAIKAYDKAQRIFGKAVLELIQRCPHENIVVTKFGVDCKDCQTYAPTKEKLGQFAG